MENELKQTKNDDHKISLQWKMLNSAEILAKVLTDDLAKKGVNTVTKLILLTNGGIIKGIPASIDEYLTKDLVTSNKEEDGSKINLFSLGNLRSESIAELRKNNPELKTLDNGSYICLKKVQWLSALADVKFDELIVFADQVVGFSLTLEDE